MRTGDSGSTRCASALLPACIWCPRFRRKIMNVPFDQGRPVWVDDPEFDLAFHVRLTALPGPGTETQMRALMGRLQSQMLDRRRPLWEIWFVEGVEGDRVGLIQKTHHCLIDGMSGIDVATVLFDLEPNPPALDVPEWQPLPPPSDATCWSKAWWNAAVEPAELVRSVRARSAARSRSPTRSAPWPRGP